MLRVLAIVAACAALAAVSGCGSDSATAGDGVRVVATTTQAADFARRVGGDRVSVTGVLPPNADPHDYEVRPGDLKALADADLVIRSGGEVDEWLGDAIDASGTDAPELVLADHVDVLDGDPHWWQDPRNAVKATAAIEAALIEADPEGAAAYERDAQRYTATLERLDREVARCIDEIPAERRTLVTTHDALGSYAARYGLRVVGAVIPSRSTLAQPSAGEVDELIATIEREHVPAIFAESSVNPDVEQAIADASGARIGTELYADALGPAGSPGATYTGSIAANTAAIVDGLTGGGSSCTPAP
jgi:zinc/manganese transport system substrate-binding protein